MERYEAEQDPLCYPGTSVLINKAGLQAQAELDDFEFAMYLSRAEEPLPPGQLDYVHYRAIHHHLFQDVFEWAGQPRSIRIAKGGSTFCYPENLERWMGDVFRKLSEQDNLVGMDKAAFARAAADMLSDINAGHPFREGNGRTQLAFLKLLCVTAGHHFDDDAIDPGATLAAMIASFHGDLVPLTALIAELID